MARRPALPAALPAALLSALVACGGGGGGSPAGPAADTTPPSVPTGVSATPTAPTAASITWLASTDDRAGAISYRLFRDGALVATVSVLGSWDIVTAPGHFCWTVVAVDLAGNASAPSAAACATLVDATPPAAPSNLQVAPLDTATMQLTFTGSFDDVGVTGYRIYRDGLLLTTLAPTFTAAPQAWQDGGLDAATRACYAASAVDGSGNESARTAEACARTPWHVETVAPGVNGRPSGATVDALGRLHVLAESSNGQLGWWRRATDGTWTGASPAPGVFAALSGGLATDASSHAHLSLVDATAGTVLYATDASGSWTLETVSAGAAPAIAVGPDGMPHVSYVAGSRIRHAVRGASGWTSELVDALSSARTLSSIAVGSDGVVQVAWADTSTSPYDSVRVSTGGAGGFTSVPVATDLLNRLSLAMDGAGAVHLAREVGGEVILHVDAGSGWTWEGGAAPSEAGSPVSLAFAGAETVIGYSSAGPRLARREGGAWTSLLADETSGCGTAAAVAAEPSGTVHLLYDCPGPRLVHAWAP